MVLGTVLTVGANHRSSTAARLAEYMRAADVFGAGLRAGGPTWRAQPLFHTTRELFGLEKARDQTPL